MPVGLVAAEDVPGDATGVVLAAVQGVAEIVAVVVMAVAQVATAVVRIVAQGVALTTVKGIIKSKYFC